MALGGALLTAAVATAVVSHTSDRTAVVAALLLLVVVVLCSVSFGMGQPALMASVGDAVQAHVRGVAIGGAT